MNEKPALKGIFLDLSREQNVTDEQYIELLRHTVQRLKNTHGPIRVFYTQIQNSTIQDRVGEILKTLSNQATPIEGGSVEGLRESFGQIQGNDDDFMIYLQGLAPLYDGNLIQQMMELQVAYRAHTTVAENVPVGIAPVLVSMSFIEELVGNPDYLSNRDSSRFVDLKEFALKHLNDFDVEIHFALPDIRRFRFDFTGMDARSGRIALDLLSRKPDLDYVSIEKQIENDPEILRPYPACMELELTTQSHVHFQYDLKPAEPGEMDDRVRKIILEEIRNDAPKKGLTVILGGKGDPLVDPGFLNFLKGLLELDGVFHVYVETFGTHWNKELQKRLRELEDQDRFSLILRLSTLKKERYQTLYGKDALDTVLENLKQYEDNPGRYTVYSELLRIVDVEDEIEEYFDYFENLSIRPIANKFNSYAGYLEERRVSDLTPLVREPCCHLERDLYINAKGRIPLCKQDPHGEREFVFEIKEAPFVRDFLNQTAHYYRASFEENLEEIPLPCQKCDEWFTYNA